MLEIIIQFERPAFRLTIDANYSDIPRWRGSGGGHTEIDVHLLQILSQSNFNSIFPDDINIHLVHPQPPPAGDNAMPELISWI
jgi:hypothetical protein